MLALATPSLSAPAGAGPGASRVVINEILYHPPDDRDDLQFVELYNAGPTAVDLSGWALTKAVEFVFPRQTELPADAYVLVCRDLAAFRSVCGPGLNVAGVFTGNLGHKGKKLELTDARGQVVDAVPYSDRAPWPLAPDGYGASLERISPAAPGDDPANWAASEVKPGDRSIGTPGRRNSCFSAVPLPQVSDVRFANAPPATPIHISATVADPAGIQAVALVWGAWAGEGRITWSEAALDRQSGDAQRGTYAGTIPPQPEGRLVRFTIRARSASGAERIAPSKTDLRPTFSCTTFVNTNSARVPFLMLLTPDPVRPGASMGPRPAHRTRALVLAGAGQPAEPVWSWTSAAIFFPPGGQDVQVFDHVQVRPRRGGLKVHFPKDEPYAGMTAIDLLFKGPPRWVLSEALAQGLYRRVGLMALETQHVRLWLGRRCLGYYLLIEQPNKSFLRRHGRDPGGNVYKVTWYGNGMIGQHEKQTNPHTGHGDLIQLMKGLNGTSGPAQWDFIREHFNVDAMIDDYAINMCLQDWDGFFNNYFAYHDLRPGGKWEVIPWDKDKTWGDYDGASGNYDWYDMPLTFGMNGAKPVRTSVFDFGPFGGVSWWRPPGYFSGPLLANAEFRRRFLARLREICETIFTPEQMAPAIDALRDRLEEEVRFRAQLTHQDPAAALREFHRHIQSFHDQVANRRKFILAHLGAGGETAQR